MGHGLRKTAPISSTICLMASLAVEKQSTEIKWRAANVQAQAIMQTDPGNVWPTEILLSAIIMSAGHEIERRMVMQKELPDLPRLSTRPGAVFRDVTRNFLMVVAPAGKA